MRLRNLEKREQIALTVCGVVVLLGVLYWLSQGPLEAYRLSQRKVEAAHERLGRAKAMYQEVVRTHQDREVIERLIQSRGPTYNLWTVVNRAVQTARIVDRAETGSLPREMAEASGVRISLHGVCLEELVNVLHYIHAVDSLIVLQRVNYLRPSPDGNGLECEIILVTPSA